MTTIATPTAIDADLIPVLEAAQARLAQSSAVQTALTTKRTAFRQSATDATDQRAALKTRRTGLVVAAHHDGDPAARAALDEIPVTDLVLVARAQDALEAEALITTKIAELAPQHAANARAVIVAQFNIVRRRHAAEGASLQAAVDALEPRLAAWITSAKLFDEQRKAVEGIHIREDNDGAWRLMGAWTVWTKALFGRVVGSNRLAALRGDYPDNVGRLDC